MNYEFQINKSKFAKRYLVIVFILFVNNSSSHYKKVNIKLFIFQLLIMYFFWKHDS